VLLQNPLEIGIPGTSGYSFTIETPQCVLDRLPGGGKSEALTDDDVDCTDNGYKTHNDGRIKNALLAQTITMGLNLRLDENLGDLDLDELFFYDYSGFSESTIQELYDMANNVLGGGSSSYNLGEIADALSAISDFFDECEELVDPANITTGIGNNLKEASSIALYPNPVNSRAAIEFNSKASAYTTLEVYNLMGKRVTTVFSGYTNSDETYSVTLNSSKLIPGVYILVLRNGKNLERMKFSVK
jgi:hypothetical protein